MVDENKVFLIYMSGEMRCSSLPLKSFATIIGRKETCDVHIDVKGISGKHAQIIQEQGKITIEDLGSTNGTYVNNEKISSVQVLNYGDHIAIGSQKFILWNGNETIPLLFLPENSQSIFVYEMPFSLGRHQCNHTIIQNSHTSNEHAIIFQQGADYILRDLDSTNGTIVDKKKVTESILSHFSEIKIGNWEAFFLCKNVVLDNFVLKWTDKSGQENVRKINGYTSIGKNDDNDIVLGVPSVSRNHCSLFFECGYLWIEDLNSSNGVKVNSFKIKAKTVLHHNDSIEVGKQKMTLCNNSLPVEEIKTIDEAKPKILEKNTTVKKPQSKILIHFAAIIAAFALLFFFFSLLFPFKTTTDTVSEVDEVADGKMEEDEQEKDNGNSSQANDEKVIEVALEEAYSFSRIYRYDKAIDALNLTKEKLKVLANVQIINSHVANYQERQRVFEDLVKILKNTQDNPIRVYISSEGICNVKDIDSTNHSIILENIQNKIFPYLWKKVTPKTYFYMIEQANLHKKYSVLLAEMSLEYNFPEECEKYSILSLQNFPDEKDKIYKIYAKMLKIPVPKNGFDVYKGQLIAVEKKQLLEQEDKVRLEAEQNKFLKEEQKLNRLRAIEIAKQREKDEFPLRYTIINEFAKTYSYNEAMDQFKELLEQTTIPEFRSQVSKRIEELKPLAKLFNKLIESINNKKLKNNRLVFGDIEGSIAEATNEYFRIVIPNGELRQRWYYLSPEKVHEFFKRMRQSSEDLFFIGVFCFENELLNKGNESFIDFVTQYPGQRKLVDNYISIKYDVPIPKGGFVAYRGKLISPSERDYLAKGLIRHGGEWVTPADKEKLEQGYVRYKGEWITGDEHELLAKGYVKYKDKWHSREEINTIRSNWEDAWGLATEHYDIKSNISEEFINEFGVLIEQANAEYKTFFKSNGVMRKMTLFAFKGYEDYRKFCIDTGNQGSLRAGGFAHSGMNVGVGWRRQKDEELISTMIHEGAHLYQFNAHPRSSAPSWLSEAIATQFEGYKWDKKNKKLTFDFVSTQRLSWIKRSILKDDHFTIPDLIKGSAGQLINSDAQKALTFYAQNWSLYYFLTHTSVEKYEKNFELFLSQAHSGSIRGQEEAYFLQYFSADMEDIEKRWAQFITQLR